MVPEQAVVEPMAPPPASASNGVVQASPDSTTALITTPAPTATSSTKYAESRTLKRRETDIPDIVHIAKKAWGVTLRDHQLTLITELIRGFDILGILPTGSGKSLIF